MSEPPPRVRVTAPDRGARPHRSGRGGAGRSGRSAAGDITEETPLGHIYVRSLLREQLLLAGRILGVLALTVGALPLLFWLAPSLPSYRVAGLPVSWLVLGVCTYPWLVVLGWRYVRAAERNERHFTELLGEVEG